MTRVLALFLAAAPLWAFQSTTAKIRIATRSVPNAVAGVPYSAQLEVSDAKGPVAWSWSGATPPGLGLGATTGAITGTPARTGSYAFQVAAQDSENRDTQNLTLTVTSTLAITTTSLPAGLAGSPYSANLTASGGVPPYSWGANGLPPGLTIIGSTITGTPTAAGTFQVTITAQDASSAQVSKSLQLSVAAPIPPLAIATASLPNGRIGDPYSATLSATGGVPPYRWSATGLPGGLSLSTGGQLAGTPGVEGAFTVVAVVVDTAGTRAERSYAVTIAPPPPPPLLITTTSLPAGRVGDAYSASLAATGGVPPYRWSATGLPGGLTMSAGGQITGTPGAEGSFTITVTAVDSVNAAAQQTYALSIAAAPPPPLQVATTSLPEGRVGTAYDSQLYGVGGRPPYRWSVSGGALPDGLSLDAGTGVISGVPQRDGDFRFTARVTDSAGAAGTRDLSIRVRAPVMIQTAALPGGAVGQDYSTTLAASGGQSPYRWVLVAGNLPAGLSLGQTTGRVSGRPTAPGRSSFTIQVQDLLGDAASREFTIEIASTLAIASTSPLPQAAAGSAYSYSFAALAGTPPYNWRITAGSAPGGLTLNAATGLLAGTPSSSGSFSFTVQVTDAASATATRQFSITVVGALTVTTDQTLPGASVGAGYSVGLAAVSGTSPYTWTVTAGALPPGLALSASSGVISGIPTTGGDYSFTVQVTDAGGTKASKALSLSVSSALRITTPQQLPTGVVGEPYTQTLAAAGGAAPYRWTVSAGSLPSGVALNSTTGALGGNPTSAGEFRFTLQVTDARGGTTATAFMLRVVVDSLPRLTATGLPAAANSLEQLAVALQLERAPTVAVSGRLTLTFEPDSAVPVDDPAIQFSTGGRTADFTIPANSTDARFSTSRLALQTGSVAGTITLTARMTAAGADVTPSPAPEWRVRVARAAPGIRSVRLVKTATGFEVWITGYSNGRELGDAQFRFSPASGSDLSTTQLRIPFADAARAWYQNSGSVAYGSQFTIIQPFTIAGSQNAIGSVSVTLINAQGSSQAVSAGF